MSHEYVIGLIVTVDELSDRTPNVRLRLDRPHVLEVHVTAKSSHEAVRRVGEAIGGVIQEEQSRIADGLEPRFQCAPPLREPLYGPKPMKALSSAILTALDYPPLERLTDGTINNCALANTGSEHGCQICRGVCPDFHVLRGGL